MKSRNRIKSILLTLGIALYSVVSYGQQDPQFTQYMYNTLSINPAYAGQRETLSAVALHRSQWTGVDGGPQTQGFSIHSPVKGDRVAIGLNAIRDALGPIQESTVDANFAYAFPISENGTKLSFGMKAGWNRINANWGRGEYQSADALFEENVTQDALLIGSGMFLSNQNWYVGFSVPNLFESAHNQIQGSTATEVRHYYLTGGYVFNVSEWVKVKPAFLVKAVSGVSPLVDISTNVLLKDKFTVGAAYRVGNSVSALAGINITDGLYIGYGYDMMTISGIRNHVGGTHEVIMRYDVQQAKRMVSPRFF